MPYTYIFLIIIHRLGYVICVISIDDDDIHPQLIDNDTGAVSVMALYSAILFKPFKNEVLDAICVMSTSEQGIMCTAGPCQIFISHLQMPDDMKFNHATGDCWITNDETSEIREGTVVRLRVLGTILEAGTIRVVGTINDTFLGQLDDSI